MSKKVFVGRLDFKATDQDLENHFESIGKITSAQIMTRGRLSLGFGFTEFANPEDAKKAVATLHKSKFRSRVIKVEIAWDPSDTPAKSETQQNTANAPGNVSTTAPANNAAASNPGKTQRNQKKKYASKGDESNAAAFVPNTSSPNAAVPNTSNPNAATAKTPNNRAQNTKPELPPKEKIPSKTSIFIANLPFSITDDGLAKIFEGYEIKSAHVVRTKYGRSRGYGFVEFKDEKDQKDAIEKKNKALVDDPAPPKSGQEKKSPRQISISVSHSVPTPLAPEAN